MTESQAISEERRQQGLLLAKELSIKQLLINQSTIRTRTKHSRVSQDSLRDRHGGKKQRQRVKASSTSHNTNRNTKPFKSNNKRRLLPLGDS